MGTNLARIVASCGLRRGPFPPVCGEAVATLGSFPFGDMTAGVWGEAAGVFSLGEAAAVLSLGESTAVLGEAEEAAGEPTAEPTAEPEAEAEAEAEASAAAEAAAASSAFFRKMRRAAAFRDVKRAGMLAGNSGTGGMASVGSISLARNREQSKSDTCSGDGGNGASGKNARSDGDASVEGNEETQGKFSHRDDGEQGEKRPDSNRTAGSSYMRAWAVLLVWARGCE